MKKICVIGLGYVGLPVALSISKRFDTVGFDIDSKRILELKRNFDSNNEFLKEDFKNRKIKFTTKIFDIKKCIFFIICVPTPVSKKNLPILNSINKSISMLSNLLKKGDIIVLESTVYPGVTNNCGKFLSKKTGLKNNKDFFMCYSPERINPGDNSKKLKK